MKLFQKLYILLALCTVLLAYVNAEIAWQDLQGPPGGMVSSLCVNNGIILASGYNGVYRAQTSDITDWTPYLQNQGWITRVIPGPSSNFYAVGRRFYTSSDGMTWTNKLIENMGIALDIARQSNTIFIAAQNGLWRSQDNGSNWSEIQYFKGIEVVSVVIHQQNSHAFVAAYSQATDGFVVYKSEDSGSTWESIGPERKAKAQAKPRTSAQKARSGAEIFHLLIDDTNAGYSIVYAAGDGVYRWNENDAEPAWALFDLTNYTQFLAFNANKSRIFAAADDGVYYRNLPSGSWTKGVGISAFMQSVTYDAVGGNVYAGTMHGRVYRSTDVGVNWTDVTTTNKPYGIGQSIVDPHCLVVHPDTEDVYAGTSHGLFRYAKSTGTWARMDSTADMEIHTVAFVRSFQDTNTWIYASAGTDGIHRAAPSTNHIEKLANLVVRDFAVNYTTGRVFGITEQGEIYYSDLATAFTWTTTNFKTQWYNQWWAQRAVAIEVNGTVYVYALVLNGDVDKVAVAIDRSEGGTPSWTWIDDGLTLIGKEASDIAADINGNIYIATYENGIYASLNEVRNVWSHLAFAGEECGFVSVNQGNGYVFTIAKDEQVYYSRDHGKTWGMAGIQYASGLVANDQSHFEKIYASTEMGVFTASLKTLGDFDADSRCDLGTWHRTNGTWSIVKSADNYDPSTVLNIYHASPGETDWIIVPGDYDGDCITDATIFHKTGGHWYIRTSSSNYSTLVYVGWGGENWIPAPGDYDGDGKYDVGVFHKSEGHWIIKTSSTNYQSSFYVGWGGGTIWTIVPADYDGDGRTDIALWKNDTGQWYIKPSKENYETYIAKTWGSPGNSKFRAVPGDYDGDGKCDFGVWNETTGEWFILTSQDNGTQGIYKTWGVGGATEWVPVPADYDGDGKCDIAVWKKATGEWFALKSSDQYNSYVYAAWSSPGSSTYMPVSEAVYTRTPNSRAEECTNEVTFPGIVGQESTNLWPGSFEKIEILPAPPYVIPKDIRSQFQIGE